MRYSRSVLLEVIVYHGRTDIKGCHCGWAELGKSHAGHVADVYEAAMNAPSHEAYKIINPKGLL